VVASRVREALRSALLGEGADQVVVTASIGIAVSPTDSSDPETLMKYADSALRDAKSGGRDTYRFYSSRMNSHAAQALALENALLRAIERDEFVLHYQPKMRIATGEWSGVEALIRWDRPGHGLVPPSLFIPVLEETGLIVPVGTWVIQAVCGQIDEWAHAGVGRMCVAVNVSGKQFLRDGFVPDIARAMHDHHLAPASLDIEITESCLMERRDETDGVLRALKAMGVTIAIDDFGTGYSSLAYLQRFPIDTLKIDISFIRHVTTSPDCDALAVAIINMGRSLKMRVIAEGVETRPQLEFLRKHACDEIQGYYCAPPMSAAETAVRRQANRANLLNPAPLAPV
jgi:EAL domain-containing protein (putative c-di-GMP-specific phosphodiesterase class I)